MLPGGPGGPAVLVPTSAVLQVSVPCWGWFVGTPWGVQHKTAQPGMLPDAVGPYTPRGHVAGGVRTEDVIGGGVSGRELTVPGGIPALSSRSREPGLPQEGREPGGRQLHKCQLHHGECPAWPERGWWCPGSPPVAQHPAAGDQGATFPAPRSRPFQHLPLQTAPSRLQPPVVQDRTSPQNWLMSGRCRLCLAPRLPSEQFSRQHPSPCDLPGCWEAEEGVWVMRTAQEGRTQEGSPWKCPLAGPADPVEGGLGAHSGPGLPPGLKTPPSFSIFFGYFTLLGSSRAGRGCLEQGQGRSLCQPPLEVPPRALGGGSAGGAQLGAPQALFGAGFDASCFALGCASPSICHTGCCHPKTWGRLEGERVHVACCRAWRMERMPSSSWSGP